MNRTSAILIAAMTTMMMGRPLWAQTPATPPTPPVKSPAEVFDQNADATKDINRARDRAGRDGRAVLILWGENKCDFCVRLHDLLHDDERIKRLVATEYELVVVDVGHYERNVELARDVYGTNLVLSGLPVLTLVNATTNQPAGVLSGKDALAKPTTPSRPFDEGLVAGFLDKNKPAPKPAVPLLMEIQQKAKRNGKRVLAYLGAYGCDHCAEWDRAIGSPAASVILEKAFVLRRFDGDRNPGAVDLFQRLRGGSTVSPPWMTALDGEGKPTAEAGTGHEFSGAAGTTATVDWLMTASGGKLTGEDREALTKAFNASLAAHEPTQSSTPGASAEPHPANTPPK